MNVISREKGQPYAQLQSEQQNSKPVWGTHWDLSSKNYEKHMNKTTRNKINTTLTFHITPLRWVVMNKAGTHVDKRDLSGTGAKHVN